MKKLKQHIQITFTIAIALVIIFSTSGFSLYSHYCSHGDNASYSIFIPAEECKHDAKDASNTSCCKVVENNCCSDSQPKEDDCCTNHAEYLKLDVQSLLNHSVPQLKLVELFVPMAFSLQLFSEPIFSTNNIIFKLIEDGSPPISTLEFLSQIQVYIL